MSEVRDAVFDKQDFRANFKNVIAKRSDLVQFAGGRIKAAGAGTTVKYEAGLVLGFATSGGDAGKYKPYNNANTDGSEKAVGVLSETTTVDEFGNGSEISVIKSGVLFKDMLIGLDAAGIVDLGGSEYVEHGVNLISVKA